MNYRSDRYGNKISLLGFGCMRFSKNGVGIDLDKATEEVKLAIDNGVNYFDTAYTYPGNEAAVGQIFERLGCRKDVYIATKLPQYLVKNEENAIDISKRPLYNNGIQRRSARLSRQSVR